MINKSENQYEKINKSIVYMRTSTSKQVNQKTNPRRSIKLKYWFKKMNKLKDQKIKFLVRKNCMINIRDGNIYIKSIKLSSFLLINCLLKYAICGSIVDLDCMVSPNNFK